MTNTGVKRGGGPARVAHVLLVDDDIELLLVYEQLLGLHGYRVSTAQNGVAALKLMKTCPVDAILCDLDMPELSGDLFYVEVSLAWPQLLKRFIFVTGHAEDSVYQHFLQTSGAIVLPKPVPVNRLLAKLREVLEPEPVATSQGR